MQLGNALNSSSHDSSRTKRPINFALQHRKLWKTPLVCRKEALENAFRYIVRLSYSSIRCAVVPPGGAQDVEVEKTVVEEAAKRT